MFRFVSLQLSAPYPQGLQDSEHRPPAQSRPADFPEALNETPYKSSFSIQDQVDA